MITFSVIALIKMLKYKLARKYFALLLENNNIFVCIYRDDKFNKFWNHRERNCYKENDPVPREEIIFIYFIYIFLNMRVYDVLIYFWNSFFF